MGALLEVRDLHAGYGRAEVLLTVGVILRMGDNASLLMLTNRLIDTRMELMKGSHILEADEIPAGPIKDRLPQFDRNRDNRIDRAEWDSMRNIFATCEEPQEWAPHLSGMITHSSAEHGVFGFESVEHFTLRDGLRNLDRYLIPDAGKVAQMVGQNYSHRPSSNLTG